jgi:hypothetical protein
MSRMRHPSEALPGDLPAELSALVYELLDAHADTAELAGELPAQEPRWAAHLDYLRALQRTARATLAQLGRKDAA